MKTQIDTKKSWLILVAIGLFTFMSTLDASIVNVALPSISNDLHIQTNEATWMVSIYLIFVSGLLIFFGRLGDLMGKIYIFRWGTLIFTVGSLLAGLNLGLPFLLFARIIQAIGASMTMSNSFGITTTVFPPHLRTRAMSMVGVFVSLGSVTGPGLGGFILQVLPWSYIFWVNVPVGIFAMFMGERLFPKIPRKEIEKKSLDWGGTISFFLTIICLFLGVELGQVNGFSHLLPVVLLITSVLSFLLFLRRERSFEQPMIQLSMFKNQLFSVSLISGTLIFITNFFAAIIMPFYLQSYLHYSPGTAGLIMMCFPITMMIVGPVAGIMGDKTNKELITAIALLFIILAQYMYTTLNNYSSFLEIALVTSLNAVGTGLFQSPNNALVMGSCEKKFLGVAGSVNALARNLGMILGISIATMVLFSAMSLKVGFKTTSYLPKHPEAFLFGMHIAFWVSFALSILTLIIVSLRLVRMFFRKSGQR